METGSLMDTSPSARVKFSGVMVLDSITVAVGKPKTVYVTGGFYTSLGIVMGFFRYFNGGDHCFEPESRWIVHTTVR